MKLYSKSIARLSDSEYKECRRLTLSGLGGSGSMQPQLTKLYVAVCRDSRAIMIRDDEGKLIAWCLLFPSPGVENRMNAYFMVHPDHRREGLGHRLFKHVLRFEKNPILSKWDRASEGFFGEMERNYIHKGDDDGS